jgi:membrane-associated phospholipid phosphatase
MPVTDGRPAGALGGTFAPWTALRTTLARPLRVTPRMIAFFLLVPVYIFIPQATAGRRLHFPELALDRAAPFQPGWVLAYGTLYLFLILLPWFVVTGEDRIGRLVSAYLAVWLTAYACFFAWPTAAPRPAVVTGDGFGAWALRMLYAMDTPYNCFPSLHVAHSFVSALASRRVHRGVGAVAILCASLVAVSTLFTRQHYVADVVAGVAMALLAYVFFLRDRGRAAAPESDRRDAPALAAVLMAFAGVALAGFWVAYRVRSLL